MRTGIAKSVAATAGAIATLVPIGRCPVCFASATGVAGSIGLSELASRPWFLLLIGAFLLAGLWGMSAPARAHWPLERSLGWKHRSPPAHRGADPSEEIVLWAGAIVLTVGFVLDLYWKRRASSTRLMRISGID